MECSRFVLQGAGVDCVQTSAQDNTPVGYRYQQWQARSSRSPQTYRDIHDIVIANRAFEPVDHLDYGDHGLSAAFETISNAIAQGKRIALYADYDVDGTMSCISWIWFLEAIGFTNVVHYIPDRFKEGYGVNLKAVQYLVKEQGAELIITMDTGITANAEARWCREQGVDFICTDHHKIQRENMPDCVILNPKLHPDREYQELCGCGITFVLLRKLGQRFSVPASVWTDILALTGMATICDIVPLNGVNHRLAQHGVAALLKSSRPVLKKLLQAAQIDSEIDETDVGFRLGPRINAVGRLEHADKVIRAFLQDDCEPLIQHMGSCNERRKSIQKTIVEEARREAKRYPQDPILLLGGEWHEGVVGIAASKIAEEFWRPVWLFNRGAERCKGSARSIPGFDVTDAMSSARHLFTKFGGHKAAGGYTFASDQEDAIRAQLNEFAQGIKSQQPELWRSSIEYDCSLPPQLTKLELTDHLDGLRPFGHCFEEPLFRITNHVKSIRYLKDKQTGEPKHTAVHIPDPMGGSLRIMFFNEVLTNLEAEKEVSFLVSVKKNTWKGRTSLSLFGKDCQVLS